MRGAHSAKRAQAACSLACSSSCFVAAAQVTLNLSLSSLENSLPALPRLPGSPPQLQQQQQQAVRAGSVTAAAHTMTPEPAAAHIAASGPAAAADSTASDIAGAPFSALRELIAGAAKDLLALVLTYVDPQSVYLAVFRSSTDGRRCVLETVKHATVTLLAYDGLRAAAWERRLRSADQALAVRGEHGQDKLVLRCPTPKKSALDGILGMSQAAGRAVGALEVWQPGWAPGAMASPWLQAIPSTFPNLHTLHLTGVCGVLPQSAQLPLLRVLLIHECLPCTEWAPQAWAGAEYIPDTVLLRALCYSIAALLPQLTSLTFSSQHGDEMWDDCWGWVFASLSTTLACFSTPLTLTDGLLRALCQCAPNLARLACGNLHEDLSDHRAHNRAQLFPWAVTELSFSRADEGILRVLVSLDTLSQLPRSTGRLTVMPAADRLLGLSVAVANSQVRHENAHK